MLARLLGLPFVVILIGIAPVTMLVPVVHALAVGDRATANAFAFSAVAFAVIFVLLALATASYSIRRRGRSLLISLLSAYLVLPLILAVPLVEAAPGTALIDGWIDMVAAFTTAGTAILPSAKLSVTLELWRVLVAWLGGLFAWITAIAILAPLNLGGFEVTSGGFGRSAFGSFHGDRAIDPSERLQRYVGTFFPIYAGLTLLLAVALAIAGARPLVAITHAAAVMSTSGMAPFGAVPGGAAFAGEAIMAVFMVFALSRLTFTAEARPDGLKSLARDAELRLGIGLVLLLPVVMFLRHWVPGAANMQIGVTEGLAGLWGGAFTTLSFLTTTGFVSESWDSALAWSGLETSGLLLLGLAVFGGGVATTAGGVKLLRVNALYKHGTREMEKLVQPHSIGGAGRAARRIRREGAQAAWVFFMLFALSIAVFVLIFALLGQSLEPAIVLTISALSTTGPLTQVAMAEPIVMAELPRAAKVTYGLAMVVGRLETLAIIALLNPSFWRL